MNINNFEKVVKFLAIIIIIILFAELGIAIFISNKNKRVEQEKTKIEQQLKKEIQKTINESGVNETEKKSLENQTYKESVSENQTHKEPAQEADPLKINPPKVPQR
ncbi:MAG: hypothetical protein PHH83_02260 [Patescibacteria group bacterium]|nr:hypothetical protein [Patescibacteria group bacterium]